MADKRKPACRIILEESRRRVVVELFPAELFPSGVGLDGRYRVRIGRRWLRPGRKRYVFWTKREVLAWLAWVGDGCPDLSPSRDAASVPASASRPDMPKGTSVSMENGRVTPEGLRLRDRTFTATEPFQGIDGQWRVFLLGRGEPELVENLLR